MNVAEQKLWEGKELFMKNLPVIALDLADNQFLKIRAFRFHIDFELVELNERSRPKRWHIQIPKREITNRHTQDSKLQRLYAAFWAARITLEKNL